ncbi:MAG: glycosyltransferase family 4 protein [Candidatus Hydrothermales bacterium]
MKVLYFLNSKSKGGLEIYFLKIAQKLKEKNVDIYLFFPKSSELFTNLRVLKFREILLRKWDIVHFFRSSDLVYSLLLKAKKFYHTNMMGLSVSKKDLYHRIIYRKIDKIFAISEIVKKELYENLPIEENRIILIYPGVDTGFFKKDINLRKSFRNEFKIRDEDIVISNTSRIEEKKGQKELLIVFNELSKEFENIKLFFQGHVEDKGYYNDLKKIKGKNVFFLEFTEDIRPLLFASDIYVFPSYGEALGFSLIEAMSSELPCIAFGERAIPEIIEDGISGFLVRNKDLMDLKNKIEILIKNKDLRLELGKKARIRVIEKFNFENYINEILSYYSL